MDGRSTTVWSVTQPLYVIESGGFVSILLFVMCSLPRWDIDYPIGAGCYDPYQGKDCWKLAATFSFDIFKKINNRTQKGPINGRKWRHSPLPKICVRPNKSILLAVEQIPRIVRALFPIEQHPKHSYFLPFSNSIQSPVCATMSGNEKYVP